MSTLSFPSLQLPWLISGFGVAAVTIMMFIFMTRKKKTRLHVPQDSVLLYQIPRGAYVPSPVPFAMKLETYLRMAKIPHQLDHSMTMSKKGKLPWIQYNGDSVADSEFCIQYLNKVKDIDLNSHLTKEERGIGRAFQKMIEENTYWILVIDRMIYDTTRESYDAWRVPKLFRGILKSAVRKATIAHGMGRHSLEELKTIARTDLQALSDYIGKKRFLLGDRPCQYDCSIFGILSELRWSPGGFLAGIFRDYPVLCSYCERMRDMFWPDWDDCITHGGTREATK